MAHALSTHRLQQSQQSKNDTHVVLKKRLVPDAYKCQHKGERVAELTLGGRGDI